MYCMAMRTSLIIDMSCVCAGGEPETSNDSKRFKDLSYTSEEFLFGNGLALVK